MVSQRRRILFAFKLVPFPLRAHGVSVRYLPIIQYLSQSHDIDLIVINGKEEELRHLDGLREYCRKISVVPDPRCDLHHLFTKCVTYAKFLLPWTPPISVVAHNGSNVTRGIVETVKKEHYDALICVGAYLLPNLISALPLMSVGNVFVDFIDSPYLWANRAKEITFRFGPLERYERWKTCQWEGKIIRKVNATIYISRIDAEAVPSGLAPLGKRHVVPNGVNIPSFSAMESIALPSPIIGFLGNMRYPPNVEAVLWMYKEVFIPMKKLRPDLTLLIIGRNPDPLIQELKNNPDVIVTGTVDDIWEYVHAVDVFVFPLWTGAGLKNKILEAMYASRPVVTTPIGNEGIEAISGKDLIICENSEDFIKEVQLLLNSPDIRSRMGSSAHTFVEEKFSWKRILKTYEKLIVENIAPSEQNFPELT